MVTQPANARPFNPARLYVVGHQRPDTDAIASAIGYAWYLEARGEPDVIAARCGQPSAQTMYALQRFGIKPPRLLVSVSPTLGHAARNVDTVLPEAPLSAALPLLAVGSPVVPVVDAEGKAAGMLTPAGLAKALAGVADVVAALATPCGAVMEVQPTLPADGRVRDFRGALLRGDPDDFLIENEDGSYLGLASRSSLLQPPQSRLVLVDHNELPQSVPGADEAEIVAVLDHHRLGNASTALPIRFQVDTVGSTCTLVAELCQRDEPVLPQHLPPSIAGMMLSGILADTLVLRSPTTTPRDHTAARWLAARAGLDIPTYGAELLAAGVGLQGRTADDVVDADRKGYEMGERLVSVAQVELSGFAELEEHREALLEAMEARRQQERLTLMALMVTDVVAAKSRLLCCAPAALLGGIPYPRIATHEWDLGDVVSRKKQLVPALLALLNDADAPA